MTVIQRQLISRLLKLRWEAWPDEWKLLKLVSRSCSASVKYRRFPSLRNNLRHRWAYLTFPSPAHCPALTNQRRGGCSIFKCGLEKRDRPVTSWLRKTFNDQIAQFSDIRGRFWRCSCWWRPGRRDRGTRCLPVTMKASWRRGRLKIRYLRRDGWYLLHRSMDTKRQGMLPFSRGHWIIGSIFGCK